MTKTLSLTRIERFMIANQMRVLEALYPQEAQSIATKREAVERGYEIFFSWMLEDIYTDSDAMTVDECKEVWDTLEMYSAIGRAIASMNLELTKGAIARKFAGYDGNNETKFMAFTEYTIERLGRFSDVEPTRPGYWNSHMPMRPVYQRMLRVWVSLDSDRFVLTEENLLRVLAAAPHPER